MKETVEKSIIEEYHQLREHFRHLENTRTKYMNFFFASLFAVFGLYAALIKIDKWEIHEFELGIGLFLFYMFSVFTLYIYTNITRIGSALAVYHKVTDEVRKKLFDDELLQEISTDKYLSKERSINKYRIKVPEDPKIKVYSIHDSAKTLLEISMVLINLLIAVIFFIIVFRWFCILYLLLSIRFFTLFLILQIYMVMKVIKEKKRIEQLLVREVHD
jgi:hypothetical protein